LTASFFESGVLLAAFSSFLGWVAYLPAAFGLLGRLLRSIFVFGHGSVVPRG
jgi:hypothetical protein